MRRGVESSSFTQNLLMLPYKIYILYVKSLSIYLSAPPAHLTLVSSKSKTSENCLCFLQIEDTVLVMVVQLEEDNIIFWVRHTLKYALPETNLKIIKFIFRNSKFILK